MQILGLSVPCRELSPCHAKCRQFLSPPDEETRLFVATPKAALKFLGIKDFNYCLRQLLTSNHAGGKINSKYYAF